MAFAEIWPWNVEEKEHELTLIFATVACCWFSFTAKTIIAWLAFQPWRDHHVHKHKIIWVIIETISSVVFQFKTVRSTRKTRFDILPWFLRVFFLDATRKCTYVLQFTCLPSCKILIKIISWIPFADIQSGGNNGTSRWRTIVSKTLKLDPT